MVRGMGTDVGITSPPTGRVREVLEFMGVTNPMSVIAIDADTGHATITHGHLARPRPQLHIYAASRLLEGMNPLGNDDCRRHQRMLGTLRYLSEMERSVLWERLVPAKLSPRSMGMLLRVMGPGVFFEKGNERFLPRN